MQRDSAVVDQPRFAIPHGILLTVLVLLSASGLLASDINLPGMSIAAQALDAPISALQRTFSVYVVGLAIAQAVYGPLSDSFGRRRLVIGGMALYTAASIACALAPSVATFGGARILQAFGAGAGMVIGRAIISDLFDAKTAARIFTTIMPIVGASPALSPLVGGYLTTYVSWRAPFVFTAALGALALVLLAAYIPETGPQSARDRHWLHTFADYPRLLAEPRFWSYAVNVCVGYAAYLAYLAASPVIFESMGLSAKGISYCYISLSVTYITGNLVSRHCARHHSLDRLLGVGYALFAAGALTLVALAVHGVSTPLPLVLGVSLVTLANGFLLPLSLAGGVTSFPSSAGAASGLMGALHLSAGALAIYTIAALPGTVTVLASFVAAIALFGCVAYPLLLRRSMRPRIARAAACPSN
ncbi:multidrug effflux MFS transporter [Trinickia caryophylli]|uniref:Bcr/CflA family efflux transporter n=1 Tax=Trinickia caryophylli TaxID=28094 RepID=A0A1X7CDU9_TRICW|nr:multidrug effflux MFS transporter [Trinickia caryophylli]PMS12571.1 MFS transporter [Trinickia caryophylli]TRX19776.1 multidrug effflux MFS transporter [Trinickia caryophylli]WQE12899.1 multidrug effflux MFS transporter [Trinickia caryophylli]SME95027.1 MFS transporter, DHA1 family, bicyclomycin/chloramphenicol resistance protein [Trinickia caryophylli]GLU30625.1 Bcr/CflA family drug resistance efflux transporter [Trinickia caryophylli]